MPGDAPPKPNRWEGTQTYKKPEAEKKRARTVAHLREEAAARSKASREKAIKNRRGSIGESSTNTANTSTSRSKRRGSVGGINAGTDQGLPTGTTSETGEDLEEEEFFDADEMPGSNKKKRQASGNADPAVPSTDATAGKPSGIDPEMRELLMSIKSDINASTNAAIDRIDKRIIENEAAIKKVGENTTAEVMKLREHVDAANKALEARMDDKLEARNRTITARLETLEARKSPPRSTPPRASNPRREAAYLRCRRTLKMWPVRGEDLEDSVKSFMRQKLGIEDRRIDNLGKLEVSSAAGKLARDRAEVLVVFEEREDRDYVKATGVNLAADRQAGMALHVPGHLLDDYYALSSVGYNIKSTHTGVKRSVKFDDNTMGLFLDICINNQWKRIFPAEAKKALKSAPTQPISGNRTLSTEDLANLIQGEPVAGLTAVVVPEESDEQTTEQ